MTDKYILAGLAVLLGALSPFAAKAQPNCARNDRFDLAHGVEDYGGALKAGNPLSLALTFVGENGVDGRYAFASSPETLRLDGRTTNDGHLQLTLYGADGKIAATFEGHFPKDDSFPEEINCSDIEGTWQDAASGATSALIFRMGDFRYNAKLDHFYSWVGAPDDAVIDRAAVLFRNAVIEKRRRDVADALSYPFTAHIGKRALPMKDAAAFLENYGRIFTAGFREEIRCAVPHLMQHGDYGVALGNGAVWFDGKGHVIALNSGPILPGQNACLPAKLPAHTKEPPTQPALPFDGRG